MTSSRASDLTDLLRSGGTLPALELPPGAVQPHNGHGRRQKKGADTLNRFVLFNAFVDGSARLVNTTAQACWYVLYRETKSTTGTATISHRQLALVMGVSRVTVTRAIKSLEETGLIRVLKRGGWRKGSSTYRVLGRPPRVPQAQ